MAETRYFKMYQSIKTEFDISSVKPVLDFEKYDNLDLDFCKEYLSKIAIVKLNGGLGTTMKCTKAKGCLEVYGDMTFLDIFIQQVISLNNKYKANVPIILMNSPYTDIDTQSITDKYLNQIEIFSFNQEFLHRFTEPEFSQNILNSDSTKYPPGTGNFYECLYKSDIYSQIKERGIEYLFISNIDNLNATLDEKILSYICENKVSYLMEVCRRTETDRKGGTPVMWKGKYHLLELAQVSERDVEKFTDINHFPYFNTNNIWIRVDKVRDDFDLYIIENKKVIEGRNLVQLESVIGSAYSCFDDSKLLEVPRNRFFPVKTLDDFGRLKTKYTLDESFKLKPHKN